MPRHRVHMSQVQLYVATGIARAIFDWAQTARTFLPAKIGGHPLLAQLSTYAMESVTHPVRLRYSAIQLEPTSMIDYSQLPVYVIFFPGRESECSV